MVEMVKESQSGMSNGEALSERPGIVALSPSLQILYMNRQAITLASLLGSVEPNGQPPNNPIRILPPPLADMAGEVLRVLRSRHETSEKGQFEIRNAANGFGKPVAIRGVGVPNGQGVGHARIVLLLTETRASHSENHRSLGSGH